MTFEAAQSAMRHRIQFWVTESDYGEIQPGPAGMHKARVVGLVGTGAKAEIEIDPPMPSAKGGPGVARIPIAWVRVQGKLD
jgi:hypothetical protein